LKNNPVKFHPWSDFKRLSPRFFEKHRPNKNNQMSSDVGSVPDPKRSGILGFESKYYFGYILKNFM